MSAVLTRRRAGVREKRTDGLVLIPVLFALWALDVIRICITQKHSNMSAMVVGRPLVGLMRSMSVPGPLLYTSPSLPISSTLTLPFFDPCSSISAFGRFRTIPSDTVSLWISDLRSEALIKNLALFSPPSRPLVRSEGGVECRQTQDAAIVADRLSASPDDDAYDWQQRSPGSASTPSLSPR